MTVAQPCTAAPHATELATVWAARTAQPSEVWRIRLLAHSSALSASFCFLPFRGLLALAIALALFSPAAAEDPLYLQTPHDQVTLNEDNDNVLLLVRPLELPGRRLPPPDQRTGEIELELLIRPGDRFKLDWSAVVSVVFFEDRLMAEAAQRVNERDFDEAQRYYQLLQAKFPQTPGLKEAVENFLWAQLTTEYRAGRLDETLALMVELHRRNPERPGLPNAYERVSLALASRELAEGNYRAARGLVRNLLDRYPAAQFAAAPLEAQLQSQAQKLMADARAHLDAGRGREAWQACRQMLEVWPAIADGQQLARQVHEQYPLVVVAVTSPAPAADAGSTPANHDFAATRAARLVGRPLVELATSGDQRYTSPFGQLERGEEPSRLTLQLHGSLQFGSPPQPLAAPHVAASLLGRADPSHPQHDPWWASQLAGITATSLHSVRLDLHGRQVAPEAWLQAPLFVGPAAGGDGPQLLGPYRLDSRTDDEARFVQEAGYPFAAAGQPAEIVERVYRDDAVALRALRRGEASVIDRVSPWELRRLAGAGDIATAQYAIPRVHFLAVNPHRPIGASRSLRRAVLYGIDRQSILRDGLLAGRDVPGSSVVSGPFPRAIREGDGFGYAYETALEPRPYDPATAAVLARLDSAAADGTSASASPRLVLVHPPGPVPRVACQSIAQQLGLVGLNVEPRELAAGQPLPDDWDLRYVEVLIAEPVVDVWPLLAPGGLAGGTSPAMLRSLRELQQAASHDEAAARLKAIHKLAATELPVIPLWQLVDTLAYHQSVQGVGEGLTSLYQNVEQWRAGLQLPVE